MGLLLWCRGLFAIDLGKTDVLREVHYVVAEQDEVKNGIRSNITEHPALAYAN